ncbi:MAG: hypothetical protein ABI919_04905 [Ramlibacter sp.]
MNLKTSPEQPAGPPRSGTGKGINPAVTLDPEDGAHQPDEHEHQVPPAPGMAAGEASVHTPPPLKGVPLAPAPLPDRPL